jgi:hypothetical protein
VLTAAVAIAEVEVNLELLVDGDDAIPMNLADSKVNVSCARTRLSPIELIQEVDERELSEHETLVFGQRQGRLLRCGVHCCRSLRPLAAEDRTEVDERERRDNGFSLVEETGTYG